MRDSGRGHRRIQVALTQLRYGFTIDEVLDNSDVIVVGNGAPEFSDALKKTREDQLIVDLVRVKTDRSEIPGQYQGICW